LTLASIRSVLSSYVSAKALIKSCKALRFSVCLRGFGEVEKRFISISMENVISLDYLLKSALKLGMFDLRFRYNVVEARLMTHK